MFISLLMEQVKKVDFVILGINIVFDDEVDHIWIYIEDQIKTQTHDIMCVLFEIQVGWNYMSIEWMSQLEHHLQQFIWIHNIIQFDEDVIDRLEHCKISSIDICPNLYLKKFHDLKQIWQNMWTIQNQNIDYHKKAPIWCFYFIVEYFITLKMFSFLCSYRMFLKQLQLIKLHYHFFYMLDRNPL